MAAQHTFELMGGLGNQLFQVAAASRLSPRPKLDLSMLRQPFLTHKSGPMSFASQFETTDLYSKLGGAGWRFLNSTRVATHRLTGQVYLPRSVMMTQSRFDERFFEKLSSSDGPKFVRGYFQDLRYLPFKPNTAESRSWQMALSSYSRQYLESLNTHWCAIHFRIGDFLSLGRSLDSSFFEEALHRVIDDAPACSRVVLFSDSPEVAEPLIKPLVEQNGLIYSRAPALEDPEQIMGLMSRANCQIISNSTFSWWAAATNTTASTIYCPKVWNDFSVPNIIPENWCRV